jgi:hypothetical protein
MPTTAPRRTHFTEDWVITVLLQSNNRLVLRTQTTSGANGIHVFHWRENLISKLPYLFFLGSMHSMEPCDMWGYFVAQFMSLNAAKTRKYMFTMRQQSKNSHQHILWKHRQVRTSVNDTDKAKFHARGCLWENKSETQRWWRRYYDYTTGWIMEKTCFDSR